MSKLQFEVLEPILTTKNPDSRLELAIVVVMNFQMQPHILLRVGASAEIIPKLLTLTDVSGG